MASESAFTKFVALTRSRGWAAFCLALWLLGLGLSANAQEGTFVTFDAPGAGTGLYEGTYPFAIDPAGVITGFYQDGSNVYHGFLRVWDGTVIVFEVPGAGTGSGQGTIPLAISPAGAITGFYCDAVTCHGFLRARDGGFTPFDAPGAVNGTYAFSMDPAGAITGFYQDGSKVYHGFLRARDGDFTTFDAPGAGSISFSGTQPRGINPSGTVAGCYLDANYSGHGFLRARDGTLASFDVPGQGTGVLKGISCVMTYGIPNLFGKNPVLGINPAEAITGSYYEPISGNWRGFLRAKDGSFTTFDAVPSPSSPSCTWTFPIAINPAGTIAGYENGIGGNHGFVRAADGAVTILDAPGASMCPPSFNCINPGTVADAINPAGQVVGFYSDDSSANHGFLWISRHHHGDAKVTSDE